MELFIKDQIPSDLLAFEEGAEPISVRDPRRLDAVKHHVDEMFVMINAEKDREAEERLQEARYQAYDGHREVQRSQRGKERRSRAVPEALVMASNSSVSALSSRSTRPPAPAPAPASAPAPAPAPAPRNTTESTSSSTRGSGVDYTQIPKQLDSTFEQLDEDAALRPTIIKPGNTWTHKSQKALLAAATSATLTSDQQKSKKDEAFDLLDGLTRAGALSCGEHASLHVVIAATHCFDLNLVDTVVQKNINPIEKVERSTLIMAAIIHQASIQTMVTDTDFGRNLDKQIRHALEDAEPREEPHHHIVPEMGLVHDDYTNVPAMQPWDDGVARL
jgi:hypothetical protein